jgi:hypothetical protein
LSGVKIDGLHWLFWRRALRVLLDGASVGWGRSGSTEMSSCLFTGAGLGVTRAVEVTTAVENVVVRINVSKTVEVVVVVSVVNAVLVSGRTRVVSCVCSCVEMTDWSTVTSEVTTAVAVIVVDFVLVLVAPFAVLVDMEIVVDVLIELVTFTERSGAHTQDTEPQSGSEMTNNLLDQFLCELIPKHHQPIPPNQPNQNSQLSHTHPASHSPSPVAAAAHHTPPLPKTHQRQL